MFHLATIASEALHTPDHSSGTATSAASGACLILVQVNVDMYNTYHLVKNDFLQLEQRKASTHIMSSITLERLAAAKALVMELEATLSREIGAKEEHAKEEHAKEESKTYKKQWLVTATNKEAPIEVFFSLQEAQEAAVRLTALNCQLSPGGVYEVYELVGVEYEAESLRLELEAE